MSQNREVQDRHGVVAGLQTRGGADDTDMAEFIAAELKQQTSDK
jgi:predicted FMN-binding regulatory protein PaiB